MQSPPLDVPFLGLAEQHSEPDARFAVAAVAELMQSDDLGLPADPVLCPGNGGCHEPHDGDRTRNACDQPNPLHVGFLVEGCPRSTAAMDHENAA